MKLAELFPVEVLGGDREPVYRWLREEHPFMKVDTDPGSAWVVSRYVDVDRVIRDPRAQLRPRDRPVPPWLGDGAAARLYRHQLLFVEPSDHVRLRRLVGRAFSPRSIEALRPAIRSGIQRRLAEIAGRDEIDVVTELGDWVPMTATCALLGIPHDDWPDLIAHMHDALPLFAGLPLPDEIVLRCDLASQHFLDYFTALVADRRNRPRDDLLSVLIEEEASGDRLTHDELMALMLSIFGGGYETSMTTIANGILVLLQHPDQWRLLVHDPGRAGAAVEEIVRWHPAVHVTTRHLGAPIERDGMRIDADEMVLLVIAAANRDETAIAGAASFCVDRGENPHLGFGHGSHFCLGASLARVTLQEAFASIPATFPELSLATDEFPRRPDLLLPSLERLPVRLGA